MSVNDTEEDVLEIPDPDAQSEVEMVPLFKMAGEIYEMPKLVEAGLALEYLEKQVEEGPDAAAIWLMKEVLGEDTYKLLKEHPTLDFNQFNEIFDRLEHKVLGGKDKQRQKQRGVRRRQGSKKPRGS